MSLELDREISDIYPAAIRELRRSNERATAAALSELIAARLSEVALEEAAARTIERRIVALGLEHEPEKQTAATRS